MHGPVPREERDEILIRSIASVAKPLLFSLLIILASFLPVFFLEEREGAPVRSAGLQQDVRDGVFDAADALPAAGDRPLDLQERDASARGDLGERSAVRAYRRALGGVIRYRYAFTVAGLLVLIPAAVLLTRFPKDFLPDVDEGAILYMPTTLPGLPNREAGWVVSRWTRS